MTEMKVGVGEAQLTLRIHSDFEVDDEKLFEFCRINSELRIERTAEGEVEIMPPTGGETSNRNFDLIRQLGNWSEQDGTGVGFDSNGGFLLPNGAMRSPDASWVSRKRLVSLTAEQKQKFLPICPEFVVEIMSPSDSLAALEAKMREYVENGAKLGWLIDPAEQRAYVFRAEREVEILESPQELAGESVLPGFVLELGRIWKPAL